MCMHKCNCDRFEVSRAESSKAYSFTKRLICGHEMICICMDMSASALHVSLVGVEDCVCLVRAHRIYGVMLL